MEQDELICTTPAGIELSDRAPSMGLGYTQKWVAGTLGVLEKTVQDVLVAECTCSHSRFLIIDQDHCCTRKRFVRLSAVSRLKQRGRPQRAHASSVATSSADTFTHDGHSDV